MTKKSPYINKRKWLDNRKEEITDLYRSGNDWSQITEHLNSVHLMPFALTKADFFRYCDFLHDEIEYGHFKENIELKQQLSDLKLEILASDRGIKTLKHTNRLLQESNLEYVVQAKEQNDFIDEIQDINEEQAKEILAKIKIIEKNEEEKTVLSNKIDQYLSDIGVGQAENKKLKERNQLNLDEIKSLKIQRLVLALLLILVIIMHFLL